MADFVSLPPVTLAWLFLAVVLPTVHCGTSSGGSCPTTAGTPNTYITVVGDDGKPICDAYVTGVPANLPFCEWSGCTCIHRASGFEPFSDKPDTLSVNVSRRGYDTTPATTTFPGVPCDTDPGRQWKISLKTSTGPSTGCVVRDAVYCSDHRVCYDGATAPGCMVTPEQSLDPGASYVCCM